MINSYCYSAPEMKDPLRSLPGYALRRASAAMLADLGERLAPLDLRHTDASILLLVEANPGLTQAAIGRALDIQRANMVPIAARLEERGLVARCPVNGRSHGLALTKAGETLMLGVHDVVNAHEQALIDRIPPADRPAFAAALEALWA